MSGGEGARESERGREGARERDGEREGEREGARERKRESSNFVKNTCVLSRSGEISKLQPPTLLITTLFPLRVNFPYYSLLFC